MLSHRLLAAVALATTAASFFLLGLFHARADDALASAAYDAKLDAIRAEMRRGLGGAHRVESKPRGTSGMADADDPPGRSGEATRATLVAQVKQELQAEMGLVPVHLLRERRESFVELYTEDSFGKTSYGTAGYLGHGYFVTVKHAVVALDSENPLESGRKIVSIKVLHRGHEVSAHLVDAGDARSEVHSGDWAIIKTRSLDLPALELNPAFAYDFAEPIFRLGNDYSKGIIVSTGYVGQRTNNGLVTALTDGHPGVSGGGVLNQRGELVGIPVGRMQGDYRFSFILPIRTEMLRKVRLARTLP